MICHSKATVYFVTGTGTLRSIILEMKKGGIDFFDILDNASFQEKGIKFKLGTAADGEKVGEFLVREFLPDEPVFRSLGLSDPKTSIERQAVKELKKAIVKTCLESQHSYSVLAVDTNGEIMGAKLGYLVNRTRLRSLNRQREYVPWLRHIYWALPSSLVNYNIVSWHSEVQLGYHPVKVLKELGGDSMFEGEVLGVAKNARGLGLGKAMVNISMDMARRLGCQYYFACVSGIYSQKIYCDLGFTVMKELIYADVKDKKGNPILNDTREHTKAQNVYLRLQ